MRTPTTTAPDGMVGRRHDRLSATDRNRRASSARRRTNFIRRDRHRPKPGRSASASAGASTFMTVGWYARSKKIPLEHVRVELWHWIHAKHCADCETKVGRIDCIELALHFTGNITDEQRTKLPQIANRCPMHQTLKSEINIQTRVAS
jgi:uncharacterized OsmC-like protein